MYDDQGVLSIPRPEVIRILGYQRYLSHSDDLDDEVDVSNHISPCYASSE